MALTKITSDVIGTGAVTSDHLASGAVTHSSLSSITTDNVSEGSTNTYFTNARARGSVSVTGGNLSYDSGTGVIQLTTDQIRTAVSGGTGVSISAGAISIGQSVATDATPTFGNITTTGYIAGPATFTIDPAAVGDNTGTVVIAGNLQVDGTTTTINSTTMEVDDLNITLASGAANAAAANGAGITVDGASATLLYQSTPDAWSFNKNVGIGTDNPGQLLHVQNTTNSAFVKVGNNNGSVLYGVNSAGNAFVSGQTSSKDLIFEVNNDEKMRIHNSGKLGIGTDTTTPTGKLTIANPTAYAPNTVTAANSYIQLGSTDYGSGGSSSNDGKFMIGFGYTDGTTNTHSPAYIGYEETSTSGDTKGELTFYTRDVVTDTAPTERMRIDTSGKVGIGTNNPTNLLHVSENTTASGWGSYPTIQIDNPNASGYASLAFTQGSTSSDIKFRIELDNTNDILRICEGGGGNDGIILANSGNVGIGTNNPQETLHLFNSAQTWNQYSNIRMSTESDSYAAEIGFHRGTSDDSDRGLFLSGDGTNKHVRVLHGGNVGIGTVNPDTSLQVSGTRQLLLHLDRAASTPGIKFTNGGSTSGTYGYMIADENEFGFGYHDGTSSTTIVRFDEIGDVGIGPVTAPSGLEVYSKVCKFWHGNTNFYTMFEDQNEINTYTSAGANSTMYLQHPGGDLEVGAGIFFVDRSASSVGIGTTNPSSKLNVVGGASNPGISIKSGGNSGVDPFRVTWVNGTEGDMFIVDDAGKVGIGETSPQTELHVKGTNNSAGDLYTAVGPGNTPSITIQNAGTTNNNNAVLYFRDDNGMRASVGARFVNHTTDETELRFSTTDGSGNTRERVTFKGTGGIGFGTSDPFSYGGQNFEFKDTSSAQTGVRVTSSASSFEIGTDSNGGYIQAITPGDGISFYSANSSAADVQAMKINSVGLVTTPYNPAFRAYLSTEQTSNGEVTSGWTDVNTTASRAYDRGGNFNISNGRFTAPVDGVYVFSVMWDSLSSQAGFNFLVNGTDYNVMWEPTGLSNDAWESKYYGTHLKLSTNDYVTLYIVHASGTNPVHQGSGVWGHFAGALIG